MTGGGAFSNSDHLLAIREERHGGQENRDGIKNAKLKEIVADLNSSNHFWILRAKNIGAFLNVRSTTVTGTVLGATDFRDFIMHTL